MAQPPPPPPFEQPNLPNYSQQSSIAEENGHTTWAKRPETFFYNVGTPISQAPDPDPEMAERRDVVKAAMLHSWNGYKKYGWGSVRPNFTLHFWPFLATLHHSEEKRVFAYARRSGKTPFFCGYSPPRPADGFCRRVCARGIPGSRDLAHSLAQGPFFDPKTRF